MLTNELILRSSLDIDQLLQKIALSNFKNLTASLGPQQSFGLLVLAPTLMKGLEPVTKSVGHFSEFQVTAG